MIRYKILSGFLALAAMLIVAGAFSIYEFSSIGESVNQLLENNYKSIEASENMLGSLEREDSGILLLLMGRWQEGRSVIAEGDSIFKVNFQVVKNNITETNEEDYIEKIQQSYFNYKSIWQKPIVDTEKEGDIQWYFSEIHQPFLLVKENINQLISLNQRTMYQEAQMLRQRSYRAIMPGIIAVVAALLFSFMFNFYISKQVISPISNMHQKIKLNTTAGMQQEKNEIKSLQASIDRLLAELNKKKS